MPNILDEYLIRLGAVIDQSGMRKFETVLREAATMVDMQSLRMAGSVFKAQLEIVGGFAAIGTAALGLVDKVAMADQEYRLFALHMYMGKDAARALKISMDALGASLEDMAWDPELRDRTRQLIEDQRIMAGSLGPDYNENMKKIRDIRFEFTRMEVELKMLGMHVVNDFFKALGWGPDTLLEKLQRFNKWVINDMPAISKKLVTEFMPIWEDMKKVVTATGHALYEAGVLFTNIVGILSGDSSLMGTTVTLDKMATAIHHVADGMATFATIIANTEEMLAHLVNAIALVADGKWREAAGEMQAAGSVISTKAGMAIEGGVAGLAFGGPIGGLLGGLAGYQAGKATEGALGSPVALAGDSITQVQGLSWAHLSQLTQGVVPPELLRALASVESGPLGMSARSDKGAIGIMQLMPDTAKQYGVNPYEPEGNLVGGAYKMRDMIKKYSGNYGEAIGAYNWGEGNMDKFLAGKATMPNETRNEIAKVLGRMGETGAVQVGSITINIQQPNATVQQIQAAVTIGVRDATNKKTQRNLTEFGGIGWAQ